MPHGAAPDPLTALRRPRPANGGRVVRPRRARRPGPRLRRPHRKQRRTYCHLHQSQPPSSRRRADRPTTPTRRNPRRTRLPLLSRMLKARPPTLRDQAQTASRSQQGLPQNPLERMTVSNSDGSAPPADARQFGAAVRTDGEVQRAQCWTRPPQLERLRSVSSSSHNAASSALGYLYQSQWPLLELLQRGDDRPDCAITLELYDDVAWEQNGTPIELLQMKHHIQASRSLGDKDMDVWRAIRAWMDTVVVGDPDGPLLTMVTTQTAAPGSAAALLRPSGRNPSGALQLLEDAARQSQS